MGLDQFAWAAKDEEEEEIFTWRKHANLQGWMENLYREKGGKEKYFNCVSVELTEEDISRLEQEHKNLETATGFFWGESREQDVLRTEEFISIARQRLCEGYTITYSSWY
jgi:hypothetical protein